ncbi:MAG: aldo/keto reductase [Planctomycetaceae bacterium]
MQYIQLGKSELHVSRIALGLGFRGQSSETEATRLIEHAIDRGINFIDCANKYRLRTGAADEHGSSEEILGRVLTTRRDQLVITTKVGAEVGLGLDGGGCSHINIMQQADRSLQRLRTDYIDLYLLHVFDSKTPLQETLQAQDDLVSSGKVRYFGCCNYQAGQVCQALSTAERMQTQSPICVQNNYSLLNRHLEQEMFPLVRDQQLGLMAYSPLAVGLLSGHYTVGKPPPAGSLWDERRAEYESLLQSDAATVLESAGGVAAKRGVTLPQLAINWVLAHREVSVAISGSDTVEQLDDNLGALGWNLSPDEMERLNQHFVELTIW